MAAVATMEGFEGYWGPPTATMDWCEGNYMVTPYAAEFFNSLTSMFIAVAGILPILVHFRRRDCMEWRFIIAFLSVTIVGLGSVAFHGTLLFEHQRWDQVPMLWTVAMILYVLFEQKHVQPAYRILPVVLFVYAVVATLATSKRSGDMQWFSFHAFFGLATFLAVCKVTLFYRSLPTDMTELRKVMSYGFIALGVAITVWLMDLKLCNQLHMLPAYDYWNFHAWGWHLMVSCGLYNILIGIWYHRLKVVLEKDVSLCLSPLPHIAFVPPPPGVSEKIQKLNAYTGILILGTAPPPSPIWDLFPESPSRPNASLGLQGG
ncbi:Acer3 [Symbiodinium sp. CCMP2456]|nr:Acer3 [Symbiodinium sp. CCMP2456]